MTDSVKQITDMMFRYAEFFDTGRFDESAPDEPATTEDERRHGDAGGPYFTCRLMSP